MSLDLVRPTISEDAPEAEEQQMVDENLRGNPYGFFPDLVWLKISSKVQDTHDWLNLYFASSKLMDLLQIDMIERVFPQVFPHLCKYLKRKDVINLCAADITFESAIMSWVQARWLAPSWAGEGYDDPYYYKYLSRKILPYSPIVRVESQEHLRLIIWELLEGVLEGGSQIPFGIIFYDRSGMQFWESVKIFLRVFGKLIWFCKLICDDEDRFPDIFIELLELIPNVIRLGLDTAYLTPLAHPPTFPHLSKLKVLSLAQRSHKTFTDLLRLHADQLEYLSIFGKDSLEESYQYSNLKKLRLTDFLMGSFPSRLDLFSQATLTKVCTDIRARDFAEFGRMFVDLNKLGASLEELELQIEVLHYDFRSREDGHNAWVSNINLPKLKNLTIWGFGVGEDLLLRLISFQDMGSNLKRLFLVKEGRRIWDIFDSDMWSILPNLQQVKFRNWRKRTTGIYTRDEYNQYHHIPPTF